MKIFKALLYLIFKTENSSNITAYCFVDVGIVGGSGGDSVCVKTK